MKERIELKALEIVSDLAKTSRHGERAYPAEIDVVWVFSGPGTYYDRLKFGQEERQRWMDRDRIRAGVAVVREVTATAKFMETEMSPDGLRGHYMGKQDILDHGTLLVYNGTPQENEVFKKALASEHCKLPEEGVVILESYRDLNGEDKPIRHTGDQFLSFFQELADPQSPLFEARNIALVAHVMDFIRHPFYADHYIKLFSNKIREISFWAYAIKNRPGTGWKHLEGELSRLEPYAAKGDLSTEPAPLRF